MIALAAFTRRGAALGKTLADALGGQLYTSARLSSELGLPAVEDLTAWTGARFADSEAIIFLSATGIAVRAIAPHVRDKFTDPAVVSVDEAGRFAVPLLSGHVGGANGLAKRIAALTGGQAVVSTATDVNGRFAVDVWAKAQNLVLVERAAAKAVSAAILEGRPVGFRSRYPVSGPLPEGLTGGAAAIGILVDDTAGENPYETTLHLVPRAVTLGLGCRRGTTREALEAQITQVLAAHQLPWAAVTALASIDLKSDEPGLLALAEAYHLETHFYPAAALAAEPGDFPASELVSRVTGVDNVCQRAAQRAGGRVFLPKTAGGGVTVAAAMGDVHLTFPSEGRA